MVGGRVGRRRINDWKQKANRVENFLSPPLQLSVSEAKFSQSTTKLKLLLVLHLMGASLHRVPNFNNGRPKSLGVCKLSLHLQFFSRDAIGTERERLTHLS